MINDQGPCSSYILKIILSLITGLESEKPFDWLNHLVEPIISFVTVEFGKLFWE